MHEEIKQNLPKSPNLKEFKRRPAQRRKSETTDFAPPVRGVQRMIYSRLRSNSVPSELIVEQSLDDVLDILVGTKEDIGSNETKENMKNRKSPIDNTDPFNDDDSSESKRKIFRRLKSTYESFSDFHDDFSQKTAKEKSKLRDEINTQTLLGQATELPEGKSYLQNLTRGTFLIARVLWDKKGKVHHDHLCFVDQVNDFSLTMVFITDIFEHDDKPRTKTWVIQDLNDEVIQGKLRFVVFNFGGCEDDSDLVLERAMSYKVPRKEVRALHFAYTCAFGLKEPIFSEEHLSLCDEQTLLLLKTEDDTKVVILQTVKNNKFYIVKDDSTSKIEMTFEELMNISGARACAIFYYPNIKVDTLFDAEGGLSEEVAHHTAEVGAIQLAEHGVKEFVEHGAKDGLALLAPELAGAASHAFGGVLHGIIASIGAGLETNSARKKEKVAKDSLGLQGFSRTQGNKAVFSAWTTAAVGSGASLAGSMGTAALIGQLAIPIPGLGLAIGAVAGGVVAGITASYVTKKVSKQVYDINIEWQCPLGHCY